MPVKCFRLCVWGVRVGRLCVCVCVRACVCLKLQNTCAFSAISFCHRRGLGRWLIENAYTAVTFFPPPPSTQQCVCVHVSVCAFICVFVFLFAACVRLSTNITLTGTLRFFQVLASFKSYLTHTHTFRRKGWWNLKVFLAVKCHWNI